MEWEDEAYVLSARAHGETGAIVDLLTERHGRFAAHVAGGASRRMKPFLQAGARVVKLSTNMLAPRCCAQGRHRNTASPPPMETISKSP